MAYVNVRRNAVEMNTLKILLACYLIKITNSEFEPAYLKVCSTHYKQVIESAQCEKGIWLKKPIEPGCVCIRGVWALTNGFCDEKPVILVGDGHCYHISFEVRSIKFIGDPKDPFKPKVYVSPSTLDAFYEVKEGSFTPTILSDSTLVIGINPRQVALRRDYSLCIDLSPTDYGKPLHIHVNPRRSSKEWTLDRTRKYSCPATTLYSHHVGFGEMYDVGKNKIASRMLVERHCKHECPGGESPAKGPSFVGMMEGRSLRFVDGGSKNITKTTSNTRTLIGPVSTAGGETQTFGRFRFRGPVKTIEERMREKEEMRANSRMSVDNYEREVNEQTLRMMHAHISSLLLNLPGPHVVTREYRYFQHIRVVVERACPSEYVPKPILKGLMRMFRQLLWETQETFHHPEGGDEAQYGRTLSRLYECAEKTVSPSLLFATYGESGNPKDNMTAPESCPPLIYAINGTAYNRSGYNKDEPQFIRNYTNFFPPHLKFNSSQVDFVIEAAWKITMIGHYRCSKYFDDATAIDFSHFFNQVQSFFNHQIVKRWYYEKSVQATYDVVKMIFPSYDLKKFMFGLDSCLAGTQGFSHFDYSNIYIQRPKIPNTENDLSQKKYVLKGASSRLSTRDYYPQRLQPLQPLSSSPKKGEGFSQDFDSAKKRRKRAADKYYLWNQDARCLYDYMEPVMLVDYAYHLPSDCTPPVDPYLFDAKSK